MIEDYRISRIPLQYPEFKVELQAFLGRHGLSYEENIDAAFGIFDWQDTLIGCGCAAGAMLKCFAVESELRGQNALGPLVSSLMQDRFQAGFWDLFAITRASNEVLFQSCGLFPVARTNSLILLENQPGGPEKFAAQFCQPGDECKVVGAVVMNCNPFTLGHQKLIEYAALECDILHVFVVEEDCSLFPAPLRLQMVQEGTSYLTNVRIHLSGPYMISQATFPTYFLKEGDDAALLQGELDATLFATCIAPTLHTTKRFAGQEPKDPVTAAYNDSMRTVLPQFGIEFCEIPRFRQGDEIISASRVRELLRLPRGLDQAAGLVPPSTLAHLTKLRKIE